MAIESLQPNVRLRGVGTSLEGVIFKDFSTALEMTLITRIDIRKGMIYRLGRTPIILNIK